MENIFSYLLQLVINSIANASIIAYKKFSNTLMHKLKIAIINVNTFVNLDSKLFEKIKSSQSDIFWKHTMGRIKFSSLLPFRK